MSLIEYDWSLRSHKDYVNGLITIPSKKDKKPKGKLPAIPNEKYMEVSGYSKFIKRVTEPKRWNTEAPKEMSFTIDGEWKPQREIVGLLKTGIDPLRAVSMDYEEFFVGKYKIKVIPWRDRPKTECFKRYSLYKNGFPILKNETADTIANLLGIDRFRIYAMVKGKHKNRKGYTVKKVEPEK